VTEKLKRWQTAGFIRKLAEVERAAAL